MKTTARDHYNDWSRKAFGTVKDLHELEMDDIYNFADSLCEGMEDEIKDLNDTITSLKNQECEAEHVDDCNALVLFNEVGVRLGIEMPDMNNLDNIIKLQHLMSVWNNYTSTDLEKYLP